VKNFSFSWERGTLSWGKNEAYDRRRGVLGEGIKRKDDWGAVV
jgi:hypothetical protein